MNRTATEPKLFAHLALTPSNLISFAFGILIALIAAITAEGWQRWFFTFLLVVNLLTCSPDFLDYQALNLGRSHWARHKRILTALFALVMLVIVGMVAAVSASGIDWFLTGCIVAVLAYRLLRVPQPPEPWAKTSGMNAEAPGDSVGGPLPMTPANQIIRGPQGKTWLGVWSAFLVVVMVIDVLTGLFAERDLFRLAFVAAMMALFTGAGVMKTVGQSLENWTHFGGDRRRWATETALLGLIGPVMMGLVGGLYIWLAVNEWAATTVGVLLVTALTIPVLAVLLELADRNGTYWGALGFIATSALFLVLFARGDIGGLALLGLVALQYLAFALILPAVARRHVLCSGGLRSWFGLRAGTR